MKRFISFNGCQTPNGEKKPTTTSSHDTAQKARWSWSSALPLPSAATSVSTLPKPAPTSQLLLAELIASTLSLPRNQPLFTCPNSPPSPNTTPSMVPPLTRSFRSWCQRYKSFFTKSAKNHRNKTKQNDFSLKFSNWSQFFSKNSRNFSFYRNFS